MIPPAKDRQAHPEALSEADAAKRHQDITDIDILLIDCRDTALWRALRRVRGHLLAELVAGHILTLLPDTNRQYDFDILARTDALDGGWTLRLLEDGEEVGGGCDVPRRPQQQTPISPI